MFRCGVVINGMYHLDVVDGHDLRDVVYVNKETAPLVLHLNSQEVCPFMSRPTAIRAFNMWIRSNNMMVYDVRIVECYT